MPELRQAPLVQRIIYLEPQAPAKPAVAQPCNGCGVCCASEPCPAGAVLSRRRHGACVALHWVPEDGRYRCGLISAPQQYLPAPLSGLAPLVRRVAHRVISAGSGCDCDWEAPS